jgi:NAD(P)-dependent dehydrogenase (short-subunit alcohol dehydrogenase family)
MLVMSTGYYVTRLTLSATEGMLWHMDWTADDIPDQTGRVIVVTGATSGLGLVTASTLAAHGAHVVLAVRDTAKAHALFPDVIDAQIRRLDLADLDSVGAFADGLHADHGHIDVLINNAGLMGMPRTLTASGQEMQFAVNHLGHFALTGLLMDLLATSADPRVVTVTSNLHRKGRLQFDDLTGEHGYRPMTFYNQSKLANAVFGIELHRRLTAAANPVMSLLAHPGYSVTNLQKSGTVGLNRLMLRIGTPLMAQPAARGALPQLYAATAPQVRGGQFYGPSGSGELRGSPKLVEASGEARDPALGDRLWTVSEKLTGVRYALPVP